jgi:hypothetical protein
MGSGLGSVNALAFSRGVLYAGGYQLSRWSGAGWSRIGESMTGTINALADWNGALYAAGDISKVDGIAVNGIVKWDGDKWTPLGAGVDPASSLFAIRALAVWNGALYAAGGFSSAGGVRASRIAKWDGNAWSALDAGLGAPSARLTALMPGETFNPFGPTVSAMAASSGALYVGGDFTEASGQALRTIARWDGTVWSGLGGAAENAKSPGAAPKTRILALAPAGDGVFVGGQFAAGDGGSAKGIVQWTGSAWQTLGKPQHSSLDGEISAIAVSGADVYIGGLFTRAGNKVVNHIAQFNGSEWFPLGEGMTGQPGAQISVNKLAVAGKTLYASGNFSTAGGVSANLAKWEGGKWSALRTFTGGIEALAASGSHVYISTRGAVYSWDGQTWRGLGGGTDGIVYNLAVSGNDLYAAGSFTMVDGIPASRIARWDGNRWSALGAETTHDPIMAIEVVDHDLYVAEDRPGRGSVRILKWNGTSWSDLGGSISGGLGRFPVAAVYDLAFVNGYLYAAGNFAEAGGKRASGIARWDGREWAALGSGVNGQIRAFALSPDGLYAGGAFSMAGGKPSQYLAMVRIPQ